MIRSCSDRRCLGGRSHTAEEAGRGIRGLLCLLLVIASCTQPAPDESKFGEVVADLVFQTASRLEGKTIVLDSQNFSSLPARVKAAIKDKLVSSGYTYLVMDMNQSYLNLHGEWIEDPLSLVTVEELEDRGLITHQEAKTQLPFARNDTHVFLRIDLEVFDVNRIVRWVYRCGDHCGWGREVHLSSVDGQWRVDSQTFLAY